MALNPSPDLPEDRTVRLGRVGGVATVIAHRPAAVGPPRSPLAT